MDYMNGKLIEQFIEEQKATNELLLIIAKKTSPEVFKQEKDKDVQIKETKEK